MIVVLRRYTGFYFDLLHKITEKSLKYTKKPLSSKFDRDLQMILISTT